MAELILLDNETARASHLEAVALNIDMPRSRGISEGAFDPRISSFFAGLSLEEIFQPGYKVLELGCGNGNTLIYLAKRFGIVPFGIDIRKPTDIPRGFNYSSSNIQDIGFRDNAFDVVFSNAAFHYVPDKLKGLKEAHRVIRIGGVGIIDFGNLVVDDDGRSEPTLKDESIVPDLKRIIKAYPNQDQVSCGRINIYDNYGRQERRSNRVLITKRSEKPLDFPSLVSAATGYRRDLPFVCSLYSI